MDFASLRGYKYQSGDLYLGRGRGLFGRKDVGIKTERHAITIAGAGAGKGACLIIPNLLRWPHNALVIDPKGEAANETANMRQLMGNVYVIDPFNASNVEDKFKASFNPLQSLDTSSPTFREDVETISDGIIKRVDPKSEHWDNGALAIMSGLITYAVVKFKPERRNLVELRSIIRNESLLTKTIQSMENVSEGAGLCEAAHGMFMASESNYFLSNLRKNSAWLDSQGMQETLGKSSFDLAELKSGHASVYLVLPANYLGQHGGFLRLFVRCALEEMAKQNERNELRDRQCLFLLDEFYSLGKIDEIAKAAGLMRGYGLQLWPILQDLGQLHQLYEREGSETFFGNSDVATFFGNTDQMTLEYISRIIGDRNDGGAWGNHEKEIGRPIMSPQDIREHVGRSSSDKVARNMIAYATGRDVLSVKPWPYFL